MQTQFIFLMDFFCWFRDIHKWCHNFSADPGSIILWFLMTCKVDERMSGQPFLKYVYLNLWMEMWGSMILWHMSSLTITCKRNINYQMCISIYGLPPNITSWIAKVSLQHTSKLRLTRSPKFLNFLSNFVLNIKYPRVVLQGKYNHWSIIAKPFLEKIMNDLIWFELFIIFKIFRNWSLVWVMQLHTLG